MTTSSYPGFRSKSSFSFIFLSLILVIFCLFSYLLSLSTFEELKVNAVRESLWTAFKPRSSAYNSFFKPSFIPNGFISLNKELFSGQFSHVQIEQNPTGHVLSATIPADDLFIPFQEKLQPDRSLFWQKLAQYLKAKDAYYTYEIDFMTHVDLPTDESYPIFSSLATRRAQAVATALKQLGISNEQSAVGFKRGNPGLVTFTLKATPKGSGI